MMKDNIKCDHCHGDLSHDSSCMWIGEKDKPKIGYHIQCWILKINAENFDLVINEIRNSRKLIRINFNALWLMVFIYWILKWKQII